MDELIIQDAREGNLKNISLSIPKNKLVVLTGLSGSGKSTLAVDVIYQECQRQFLEAIGYQGIRKPKLAVMKGASPAIRITPAGYSNNPRSTVGTVTNIYTGLRMLYEKLAARPCPHCRETIESSQCREETEKLGGDFKVYMLCSRCGHRMEKLTRSCFSYNTREGACQSCQGLGKVLHVNLTAALHEQLSLKEGAVDFWEQQYKEFQIVSLQNALAHYGIPLEPNLPVASFTKEQKAILLHGVEGPEVKALFPTIVPPKTVTEGRFEGIVNSLWRKISEKDGHTGRLDAYFTEEECPDCKGERLNELSRNATVMRTRLPALAGLSLTELHGWLNQLDAFLETAARQLSEIYLLDLKTKLRRIENVGLGYLSLSRQTMTLSGGEAQRIRLAAALDSELTGVIYIMDEPTVGLHPSDTDGIVKVLKGLRDLGNTVLVIEHDIDVMRAADFIVDIGPGSGLDGGEIIGMGTLEELEKQPSSVTGTWLKTKNNTSLCPRRKKAASFLRVENAALHNLKNVCARFPIGRLTAVTGVSGSGKSTLVFEVLAKNCGQPTAENGLVTGAERFDEIVIVEQAPIARMNRSNVATYSGVYTEIRKIYEKLPAAKEQGLSARHFSFNTKGGRCENCGGLGYVFSNMLFFEDIEIPCPTCMGKRFSSEVLSVQYHNKNINDILLVSVQDALTLFSEYPKIVRILKLLSDVGLNYLQLGQTLATLSGGEAQRLKLSRELLVNEGRQNLYLIDEPTTGLHPVDVEHFLALLNTMVEAGNTVIVVEHNQQVIAAADWVVDLGPGGGTEGGQVIAEGSPDELKKIPASVTGRYLAGC